MFCTTMLYSTCATLWTISMGLMIAQGFVDGPLRLAAWSLLIAFPATLNSAWLVLRHERHRVETIARVAAQALLEEEGLRSV